MRNDFNTLIALTKKGSRVTFLKSQYVFSEDNGNADVLVVLTGQLTSDVPIYIAGGKKQ